MAFRIGQWVLHEGRVAVVFERPAPENYIVHYVDENGETVMRFDGPRGTEEGAARESELTAAGWDSVPVSRRPVDAEMLARIEAGTAEMPGPFQPAVSAVTGFEGAPQPGWET